MDHASVSVNVHAPVVGIMADIRDAFEYPPVKRILHALRDESSSEVVRMFMRLYLMLETEYPDPHERIARLQTLIHTSQSRQLICDEFIKYQKAESHYSVGSSSDSISGI